MEVLVAVIPEAYGSGACPGWAGIGGAAGLGKRGSMTRSIRTSIRTSTSMILY